MVNNYTSHGLLSGRAKVFGISTGQSGRSERNVSKKICGKWCMVFILIDEISEFGRFTCSYVFISSQFSLTPAMSGISSRKAAIMTAQYPCNYPYNVWNILIIVNNPLSVRYDKVTTQNLNVYGNITHRYLIIPLFFR